MRPARPGFQSHAAREKYYENVKNWEIGSIPLIVKLFLISSVDTKSLTPSPYRDVIYERPLK